MIERWLEFHDSQIDAVASSGDALELRLSGYVHHWETTPGGRRGTGWIVPVVVRLAAASPCPEVTTPARISDGTLSVGGSRFDNVIPLPFDAASDARLTIALDSGSRLELTGSGFSVVGAGGEPRFLEVLPEDSAPDVGSG